MQKKKKEIIELLKTNKKDVGSSEVQILALSEKINYLAPPFKRNKNVATEERYWHEKP